MALVTTLLTGNYDSTDATSYTTASISPAANSIVYLFYFTREATTAPDLQSPTGVSGITWTKKTSQLDGISLIGVYEGICSGSPGTGTLSLATVGGVTAIGCGWSIIQVTGADTTTPTVQNPVGATGSTGTASSLTFAAAGAAGNRFISYHFHRANEGTTPRTNWTELDDRSGTAPNVAAELQWRDDGTNETTASATWVTSSRWQALGVEVKVATGGSSIALDSTTGNDGVSTTTASLTVAWALASTDANGVSTTTADITELIAFVGTSDGLSSTTADMVIAIALQLATSDGLSTADATQLTTIIGLTGTADGVSTTAGDLVIVTIVQIDGTAAGVASVPDADLSMRHDAIVRMVVIPRRDRFGRKRAPYQIVRSG